jgi:hypothetical protein
MRNPYVSLEYVRENFTDSVLSEYEILRLIANSFIYADEADRDAYFMVEDIEGSIAYILRRQGELMVHDLVEHFEKECVESGLSQCTKAKDVVLSERMYHNFL